MINGRASESAHLGAELQINSNDSRLHNSQDQDRADDGKKAKDVVIPAFILPQTPENEEELDEDDCKGNHASD